MPTILDPARPIPRNPTPEQIAAANAKGESIWIIRADVPFSGTVHSLLDRNGLVSWSGGLTFEQYAARHYYPLRLISEDELHRLHEAFTGSRITPWALTTRESYMQALECLPPARWHVRAGVEMFHVSERITHDLVDWYATDGRDCFVHCVDRAGADWTSLSERARVAMVGAGAKIEEGGE